MNNEETGATGPTLLLIEDDRDICEIVAQVLAEEGYRTVTVPNGEEGLKHLRAASTQPFLIVLDLMLPVMDAWQFRSEQAQDAKIAGIPVVIFSANPKLQQHADSLGAAAVIRKPPDLDEFLAVVGTFVPAPAIGPV
jgi:two-component system, chemotaxis family, chemotaxis protein CheY